MAYIVRQPAPYACAICGEDQTPLRMYRHDMPIPPLCRSCESGGLWATGYTMRYRYKPERHPDRRILNQLRALADQLHDEAARARS